MRILICGANGFVGRALCSAFVQEGHHVLRGVRHATSEDEVEISSRVIGYPGCKASTS
jgi:uncharacterized protein YbjT (DUF2867 family)